MNASVLLGKLKPGYRDNPQVEAMRAMLCEMQSLIDAAHAAIAAIHQPDNLGENALTDWQGHDPLQLEYREENNGSCSLEFIRVRGVRVPDFYLADDVWEKADDEVRSWKPDTKNDH